MGLSPHEYFSMSPLEYYYASKGYSEKHWDEWDKVRHIMYVTASTVPSKKKLPRMKAWMPLPNDKSTHSVDEIKEMFKMIKNGK